MEEARNSPHETRAPGWCRTQAAVPSGGITNGIPPHGALGSAAMFNFAGVDYQLRWPRTMFMWEAAALVDLEVADNQRWWVRVEQLFEEAFTGRRPADDLRAVKPRLDPLYDLGGQ